MSVCFWSFQLGTEKLTYLKEKVNIAVIFFLIPVLPVLFISLSSDKLEIIKIFLFPQKKPSKTQLTSLHGTSVTTVQCNEFLLLYVFIIYLEIELVQLFKQMYFGPKFLELFK